jgi:two-component system sensor histidine kinase DegS
MISGKNRTFTARINNWIRESRPPFHNYRFWIIQLLVLIIGLSHIFLEKIGTLVQDSELYVLSISPIMIPIVYAALNFGRKGAIPTAAWALLIWVPEIIPHNSTTRLGILIQFGIIGIIAAIVANRVDREGVAARATQEANVRLLKAKENLEIYIELATEAQEEERKRLSRELHDDTMQSLVLAIAEIGAVTASDNLDGAHGRLLRVQEILTLAIVSVRRYCRDLRPSLLDDLGLVDAIEWLASDLESRVGISIIFDVLGERRWLVARDKLLVFRVVQEALHNVERHSGATQVHLELNFNQGTLAVSIADNGRGMSTLGPPAETGLGLRGMDERTKLLKGTLIMESQPGRGTKIILLVPIS